MYRPPVLGTTKPAVLIRLSFNDTTAALSFSSNGLNCFGLFFLNFLLNGSCERSEFRIKPPNFMTQTEERAEFGVCSGVFEHCHHVGRMLCKLQAAKSDNLLYVVDNISEELTYLQIECDSSFV